MTKAPLMLCLVAVLVAAGSTALAANGWQLQLSDDFERDALGPDWAGDIARIEGGTLFIGKEDDMGNNFVHTRKGFAGAQRVEFDAMAPTDRPCDLSAALNCDARGYASGFLFGFGSQMNTFSQLMLRGQVVGRHDTTITPHKWHHIVAQREGHRFTHTIDGKVVLDYTHADPLPGPLRDRIGFYVWHVARIDNVRVYTKPESVRVAAAPPQPGEAATTEMTAQARSYPDPGKILVSVETPSIGEDADDARLTLAVTLSAVPARQALRRSLRATVTGMREEIVLDAADLPAGEYRVTVTLTAEGRHWRQGKDFSVPWPGRSEAFRDIRVLNNFVWELLDVAATDDAPIRGAYRVRVPYDRWLFVRSVSGEAAGRAVVTLDGDTAEAPLAVHAPGEEPVREAMRFVQAGEHTVRVAAEGGAALERLTVRAVPEIQHSRYPTSVMHVKQGVEYDWEFLGRHILPNVNTIISGGLPESALPHVEEWKQRGGRWITYMGRPGLHGGRDIEETPEGCADYYASRPGYAHPLMDGVLVDEFYTRDDPAYAAYVEATRLLNDRFPGKAFYPYAAGAFGKDEGSVAFAEACIEGGGYVCWEAYLAEWPTLKQGLNAMRRYPHVHVIPFEEKLPGVTRNIIWVFGVFSFPWPYADGYASVNYNAYLDMQFQFIATHPALFGLGGVHVWRTGYSDEERVRWFGRMFRHYCIEGRTGRANPHPYLLGHIRNPDFAEGAAGWTLEPAAEGSIEAGEREGFGKFIGRYYRGPDTFLVTRRQAERPNVFSQEIRGLQAGRLYSVKMFTGDHGALVEGASRREVHPVSLEVLGAQALPGPRHSYQTPFPTRSRMDGFTDREPFWLNYHWQVFRATGVTATLRISDWRSPQDPGGPEGAELLYTFIEVKPYLAD